MSECTFICHVIASLGFPMARSKRPRSLQNLGRKIASGDSVAVRNLENCTRSLMEVLLCAPRSLTIKLSRRCVSEQPRSSASPFSRVPPAKSSRSNAAIASSSSARRAATHT